MFDCDGTFQSPKGSEKVLRYIQRCKCDGIAQSLRQRHAYSVYRCRYLLKFAWMCKQRGWYSDIVTMRAAPTQHLKRVYVIAKECVENHAHKNCEVCPKYNEFNGMQHVLILRRFVS